MKRNEGRVGENRGSFHSELTNPRRMKSRVNGLLRQRRRERKREGAGEPGDEGEGDWKREEVRAPG